MQPDYYLYDEPSELQHIERCIRLTDQLTAGFCGFCLKFLPLYTLIQFMR